MLLRTTTILLAALVGTGVAAACRQPAVDRADGATPVDTGAPVAAEDGPRVTFRDSTAMTNTAPNSVTANGVSFPVDRFPLFTTWSFCTISH